MTSNAPRAILAALPSADDRDRDGYTAPQEVELGGSNPFVSGTPLSDDDGDGTASNHEFATKGEAAPCRCRASSARSSRVESRESTK